MSKKTNEKNRVRQSQGLLTNEEEYLDAKKRLEFYRNEYKWIAEASEPTVKIKEVVEEAKKIRPMISGEKSESQKYYQKYYNTLIRKKALIEEGAYIPYLKRNIMSLVAQISQYQIDTEDYTVSSLFKAVIHGDKEHLSNWSKSLKMDRFLSRLRVWDGIPKEEPLALQSSKELLAYIDKHCNLIGIEIPKSENDSNLLPAIAEGYLSPSQKRMIDMADVYIKSGEISNGIEINTKFNDGVSQKSNTREEVAKQSKQHTKSQPQQSHLAEHSVPEIKLAQSEKQNIDIKTKDKNEIDK